MKACLSRCAIALVLIMAAAGVWGQGSAAAVVEFSSGDDIVVIRGGRKLPIQDPIGLELYQGDQIQTGKGVFVEIRLTTGDSILKLAENTTFVLERMSDGQTALQLVYGRVRAKVAKLAGTDSFSVRSTQAVAGVRGTDFGLDVVAVRSAQAATATTAYCFAGSVEVTAFVRSDAQAAESLEAIPRSFTIEAGEMLKVEGASSQAEAVKSSIDDSIRAFWSANDYVSEVPPEASAERAAPASPPRTEAPTESRVDERAVFDKGFSEGYAAAKAEFQQGAALVPESFVSRDELDAVRAAASIQKAGAVATGILVTASAAAFVRGFVLFDASDADGGLAAFRAGSIIGAMAVPFLAVTLIIKP